MVATVPTTAVFNEAEGIGPGFVSDVTGRTITYAVNNAVNVPVGTKIRLEFSNINNPLNPSTNYKVTVTTRNAADYHNRWSYAIYCLQYKADRC